MLTTYSGKSKTPKWPNILKPKTKNDDALRAQIKWNIDPMTWLKCGLGPWWLGSELSQTSKIKNSREQMKK